MHHLMEDTGLKPPSIVCKDDACAIGLATGSEPFTVTKKQVDVQFSGCFGAVLVQYKTSLCSFQPLNLCTAGIPAEPV
jgi:hypothetical protein